MEAMKAAARMWELIEAGLPIAGLSAEDAATIKEWGSEKLKLRMQECMKTPVGFSGELTFALLDAYYVVSWASVFHALAQGTPLRVMEVASGDTTVVPNGMELYDGGQGSYATANLNHKLTENFLQKTNTLKTAISVVEDDGANMGIYYSAGSFDVIAFQHAVNDIVQTIICENEGLDTVHSDWWEMLPEMIRITADYHRTGRLEPASREGFLACVESCMKLLTAGGHMVFNNIVYQYDIDLGYPPDLYASFIPLARKWIAASGLPLHEVTPQELDGEWWMVMQYSG
jgi:hypothetical protein